MVNKLTNWQRNQWARAGYPGLRKGEPDKVEPFTKLRRVEVMLSVARPYSDVARMGVA